MIRGAHFLLYSKKPEADRKFLKEKLGLRSVDAGHGWLIFGLPPAELAVHPAGGNFAQPQGDHDLLGAFIYFMCDDVKAEVKKLKAKKVKCAAIEKAPWGMFTSFRLPSGGGLGLYQPTHPTAIETK